jgi:hypothetical protein
MAAVGLENRLSEGGASPLAYDIIGADFDGKNHFQEG